MMLEEFLNYSVVKLSQFKVKNQAQRDTLIKKIITGCTNEAVVLQGEAPLDFVLPLFIKMTGVFREIVWRKTETDTAILLYSTIEDPAVIIRSIKVVPPAVWTDKELGEASKKQKNDKRKELNLNLNKLWLLAKKHEKDSLKNFLKALYGLSAKKDKVVLSGKCPVVPAILAMQWFLFKTKEVYYEKLKLK